MMLTAQLSPVSRAQPRLPLAAALSGLLWIGGLAAAALIAYLL